MTHSRPLSENLRLLIGLFVAFCCVAGAVATREDLLGDPDIWWHIRAGSWIWQHGTVPTVDSFSYTFAGQPWIAKEWLSQVIFNAIYVLGGWNGVASLAAVVIGLAGGLLYFAVSESLRPSLSASLAVVCLFITSSAFVVRPHLLTLPLLVIWTHQLFRASADRRAPNYLLLVVLVLWANLHAAFTMGFVIAFCAFLDFLENDRFAQKRALVAWIIFLVLCPLVTVLHPYSYHAMLATLAVFKSNDGLIQIGEWQPFNAQEQPIHAGLLLLLLFGTLVSGLRLGYARSLLLVALTYLFMEHVRYAFFLFPVMTLIVPPVVAKQFPLLSADQWRKQPMEGFEERLAAAFRPLAAVFASAVVLALALQSWVLHTAPPEKTSAATAIAFAKAHGITGNVLNYYDFGGPLVLNGIPSFVDGRTDQLFRDSFGRQMESGMKDESVFEKTLSDYDVQWTLLPPNDPRLKMLSKLSGWKQVYADKYAVIYQRQGAAAD